MVDKIKHSNSIWFTACIFLLGLLMGIGSTQISTISKVTANTTNISHLEKTIDNCIELQKKTLGAIEAVVNQNTVLINAISSP